MIREGFIIMMDILGYKDFVTKKFDYNDFFDVWRDLKYTIESSQETIKKRIPSFDIYITGFSDTYFICISFQDRFVKENTDDIEYCFLFINHFLPELLHKSLLSKIYLRGAISFGEYAIDTENNIIIGEALNDAAEWCESTNWMGIILSPSAAIQLEKVMKRPDGDGESLHRKALILSMYATYPIPYKNNNYGSKYAFNLLAPFPFTSASFFLKELRKKFSETVNSHSEDKYKNTMKFLEFCLEKIEK